MNTKWLAVGGWCLVGALAAFANDASSPIGVFPLQWNSSYETGVPYEMAVEPAKLTALGGIAAGKSYKLTATTGKGAVDVPFTLIVDKLARNPGDRSANTVTLRFVPPAGTTALTLEEGKGEMRPVQSDTVDNFFASVLKSSTGWSTDGNYAYEVTPEGLVIKVTTERGVNPTASYEKAVPEALRGRSVCFEMDVKNIGRHAFGNPIQIYQYDQQGKPLPENVFDRRYTTQYRPVGKLMRLRAKGRIHSEAAKLKLCVIMRSHGRSYDEAGMPMKMTVEDASKLLVSRLALRAENELPFPSMDASYFAQGVTGTGDDLAFVLNEKRGFCYNVNSQAVWSDGTQVRGESDRFFPGASAEGGTVEAWVKPDWTGRSTVYLFTGHFNHGNGTLGTVLELTYKPSDHTIALTMRDRAAKHTFSGKATREISGGAWHHLAVAWKPNATADVYLDGESVLAVALPNFLIMDTTEKKWADTWAEEFVFGTAANSIRAYIGDPTTRFQGLLDNLRASTGRRYTANFTPAKSFAVDADTRALFTFDMSIDGRSGGGLKWVAGSVDSDRSLYDFTPAGANGAYYTGKPRADIDYDRNIQLNNYPVMPTAKQLRATRIEKRKAITMRRGEAAELSIDAANVYPDFIEVKNPSATETLAYPMVLNVGEHDPRSWADLKETLFDPNTNDVGNAERVFQYIIKAGDYMGDYCVDYAPGTEDKQQATYLSLSMLNAYPGFECGPQNTLTCNTLVHVAEIGAGMTGGYGHLFEHAHYDGETHLYDMSTTLRAFPPDWTGEKVFSLIDAEREMGMFKHFHGEVGYHFIKMSTREAGSTWCVVVSAKYGPVLNPGESFRVYWRNNGQFNDYRYRNNVLQRWRRQFPDYGNGFILYRGAPNAASPALTDLGNGFTYKIAIQYPFVAGRYRAIKAGNRDAEISYSFDRGKTWADYTPGALLELPVKGRHEMLLKVKAALAEIQRFDFATEVQVNSRTYPGRLKPGNNRLRLKTVSGETAQVVLGWREDADTPIVIDGIFERGDRPGDETAVVFVNPDEGAKALAISGVSGAATAQVIKLPIDRASTGERLNAAIGEGKLVLTAVNYSGPFIEGVRITDGEKVKYLTVVCERGLRVMDSSQIVKHSGAVADGTDTAKSTMAYKHIDRNGQVEVKLGSELTDGNYMALYFERRSVLPNTGQLNALLPDGSRMLATNGVKHTIGHQNPSYDYWETNSGEKGGYSRWRWSMPMESFGSPAVFAMPKKVTSMRYVVWNGTEGIDLAAVVYLPATDDAEFKDQLVRNLTGYNTNPWSVNVTAE